MSYNESGVLCQGQDTPNRMNYNKWREKLPNLVTSLHFVSMCLLHIFSFFDSYTSRLESFNLGYIKKAHFQYYFFQKLNIQFILKTPVFLIRETFNIFSILGTMLI